MMDEHMICPNCHKPYWKEGVVFIGGVCECLHATGFITTSNTTWMSYSFIPTTDIEAMKSDLAEARKAFDLMTEQANFQFDCAEHWRKKARKWKRRYRDIHEQNILSTLPREEE